MTDNFLFFDFISNSRYNNNYHKDEFHWTDTDGNILKRYNPVTGKTKSEYGAKPWNRK